MSIQYITTKICCDLEGNKQQLISLSFYVYVNHVLVSDELWKKVQIILLLDPLYARTCILDWQCMPASQLSNPAPIIEHESISDISTLYDKESFEQRTALSKTSLQRHMKCVKKI